MRGDDFLLPGFRLFLLRSGEKGGNEGEQIPEDTQGENNQADKSKQEVGKEPEDESHTAADVGTKQQQPTEQSHLTIPHRPHGSTAIGRKQHDNGKRECSNAHETEGSDNQCRQTAGYNAYSIVRHVSGK